MDKKIPIAIAVIVIATGFLGYYFFVMQNVYGALGEYKDRINEDLKNTINDSSNRNDVVNSDEDNFYVRVYQGDCPGPQCGCQIVAQVDKTTEKVLKLTYDNNCTSPGGFMGGVTRCGNFDCGTGAIDNTGDIIAPPDRFELSDCEELEDEELALCYENVAILQKDLSICYLISDEFPEIKKECIWARG